VVLLKEERPMFDEEEKRFFFGVKSVGGAGDLLESFLC